jgi:Rnl2 family RNA ligase
MHFQAYPSLISTKKGIVRDLNEIYQVTEKVHGANFSIVTDGVDIQLAKRTSFLAPQEYQRFYNAQVILDQYQDPVLKLFTDLELEPAKDQLTIFGELYGGLYPKTTVLCKPVQVGIYYSQTIRFYAFDVCINGRFQNLDRCQEWFKNYKIPCAEPEFTGTLMECLEYSNGTYCLPSSIPAKLGYPPIEGNAREGNVISPLIPAYLGKGSRVIFKHKNPAFSEKKKPVHVSIRCGDIIVLESDQVLFNEATSYITLNRYHNLISKIGPDQPHAKVIGMFVSDAFTDFKKDFPDMVLSNSKLLKYLKQGMYVAAQRLHDEQNKTDEIIDSTMSHDENNDDDDDQ